MNDLDLQIIRRMGVAPFLVWPHPPSSIRPAALARSLKVSTDTIKRRLAQMRRDGVFHGAHVFPNPRLLGLRTASLHFRPGTSGRKRASREAVGGVDGVLGVFDMVGGDRCVDVAFKDDADKDRVQQRLGDLLGAPASHFVDYATPVPPRQLSALDWRIMAGLRAHPDASLQEIAAHVGVSLRTVKRRFDRMAQEGAIDVIGLFDPGAIPGHLLVDLLFYFAPGAGKTELATVLNAFRTRWVAQWSPPDQRLGQLTLVVLARSARELEDLRREGESLACVERCDALVLEGVTENWGWMDAEIRRRAALADDAVPAPVPTPKAVARARS